MNPNEIRDITWRELNLQTTGSLAVIRNLVRSGRLRQLELADGCESYLAAVEFHRALINLLNDGSPKAWVECKLSFCSLFSNVPAFKKGSFPQGDGAAGLQTTT